MCENNFTEEQEARRKNAQQKSIEKAKKKAIEKIEGLLKYAEFKYGCKFPSGFAARMYEVAYEKWIPEKCVIDALVAQWRVWKPYVAPEFFQSFIQHELENMFKIQTTSTFSSSGLNQYIGNKAVVVNPLPEMMSTTVYMDGVLVKNGWYEVR